MDCKSLHVKSMVVGSDFRFGHNRKGDHILLEKLSATYGYTLRVVDKIQYEDGTSAVRLCRNRS